MLYTFFYSSEADYKEPTVEHKLEIEKSQLVDLVVEAGKILANMRKLLESSEG